MNRFPGITIAQDRQEARIQGAEEEAESRLVKPALRALRLLWALRFVCGRASEWQSGAFLEFDSALHESAADFISTLADELEGRGCSWAFIDRFVAEARKALDATLPS